MDLGLLRSVRHTAYEKAKKLYEQVVPPPKQSKLQEKGVSICSTTVSSVIFVNYYLLYWISRIEMFTST